MHCTIFIEFNMFGSLFNIVFKLHFLSLKYIIIIYYLLI